MSPAEIKILIHCYSSPTKYRGEEFDHFIDNTIDELIRMGLVEDLGTRYATTKKGEYYVEALCNLPLPQPTFYIPMRERRRHHE